MDRSRRCLSLVLLAVLAGCHSLSRIRLSQNVRSGDEIAVLDVWFDAPGPVLSDPQVPVYDAVVGLVFYPWDKISSLVIAAKAPFDGDLDVQWGPIGALVGCTVPWVTLIPYIYPPLPLPDVELAPEAFARLQARIGAGDGVGAYREIVGDPRGRVGGDALHEVRIATAVPEAR